VVTINSQTKEITKSGQYWAFAHYSRLIRRGARRFDSQSASNSSGLQHVAVENPDGQQVLVATNPGPARTIELRLGTMAALVPLKADSVTTLAWK
jgi:glucosylceramidase